MRLFLIYIFLNFYLLSFSFPHFAIGENIVTPVGERSATPIEDSVAEATLKVDLRTKDSQNSVWRMYNFVYSGTTFSIGPNLFVTSFHILNLMLKNESSIKNIIFQQGEDIFLLTVKRIVAVSALYDLAIFETEKSVTSYLNIADNLPQSNEKILILGYSQRKFKEIKQTEKAVDSKYLYTLFSVDHSRLEGTSGSPVLNTEGQVVGVASAGTINMLFVIKLDHLKGLIAGDVGLNCFDLDTVMCIEEEMKNLRNSAEQGHAPAQYLLGLKYYSGVETKQDFKLAFDWMKKSAEQGYALAQRALAGMYYNGVGTERDFELAFDWIKKSAEQGHALAQHLLAKMYDYVQGAKRDIDSVLYWYKKSAEQGYVLAQYILALRYYSGVDTKQDFRLAFYWYKKSAEQGYAPAQHLLANMYHYGVEVDKDLKLAFHWTQESAEQGYTPAQYILASMYYYGVGVDKDLELANYWLEKSKYKDFFRLNNF